MSKTLVDSEDISSARVVAGDPFFGLIEDAYREFKAAPPSHLGICTCGMCMGPDRSRAALRKSPRDWTLADVWSWSDSVKKGLDQTVWSWLLQRFLEVLAAGEGCHNGVEHLSLSWFETGKRSLWSSKQWAVLDRFAGLFMDRAMQSRSGEGVLYEMLILARGGWPLDDLIARVMADPDLSEALAYAWGAGFSTGDLFGSDWSPEERRILQETFVTKDMADHMFIFAFADGVDPEMSEAALQAGEAIASRL